MNFRDRSPNRMGGPGPMERNPRFRPDFRPFGRGRFGGDGNRGIIDDRRPAWKDGERFENRNQGGGFRGGHGGMPGAGGPGGAQNLLPPRDLPPKDQSQEFNNRLPPERDSRPMGGPNARAGGPPEQNKWNEPPKQQPASAPPPNASAINNARTNDVEIIVTHKTLTEYAEFIERRLKTVGLSVDLLFPNEEVPLGRVLANIASRGTLYALVVTQLSEERRSVTVNVLYGQSQEHRNMPLDDAIALIVKLFDSYMKGEKSVVLPPIGALPITAAGIPLAEKHPELIQSLLSILVENRSLNVVQYDKIIAYLQDKREQQVHAEHDGLPHNPTDSAPRNTKTQLENRILNILSNDRPGLHPPTQHKESSTLTALQKIVQSNLMGHPGGYGRPLGPRV